MYHLLQHCHLVLPPPRFVLLDSQLLVARAHSHCGFSLGQHLDYAVRLVKAALQVSLPQVIGYLEADFLHLQVGLLVADLLVGHLLVGGRGEPGHRVVVPVLVDC